MRKRKILKKLDNSSRTKLTATCYASRRPWYYITNIFCFQALITSLSLSVFAWETDKAINRLAISFTLILTTVTCKTAWTRTMPTVSYMSSADKYQIASQAEEKVENWLKKHQSNVFNNLIAPFKDRNLIIFLVYFALWGFAVNLSTPFFNNNLGVSPRPLGRNFFD